MNSTHFQAWRIHRNAGRIEPRFESLSLHDLGPGEVVIRAEYSSLNYKDALALSGRGKILRHFPLIAGIDVAGRVESSTDPRFKPGDRVLVTGSGLGEETDGGFSAFVRVTGEYVIPLPDGLDARSAMQLGTAGFTAALACHRMETNGQRPTAGPIAVTGASGGTGSLAVAYFSRRDYRVIAFSSKPSAHDWLRALGAREVIAPKDSDMGAHPLESARYAGAVDTVGGELLSRLLAVIDWWGNVAAIGNAGGDTFTASAYPFILRGVSLIGINSMGTPRPLRIKIWENLARTLDQSLLDRIAGREIALADIMDSIEPMLAGRAQPGRVLVHIGKA